MIWPLTYLPRFDGHPRPTDLRFDGLTILITAASSSIGLAAAQSLAERGVATLIVTARDELKASKTKTTIENHISQSKLTSMPKIIALPLEMSDPSSMLAFTKSLNLQVLHLDHAILNAGTLMKSHVANPHTGYEETVQINAISPIFLATQLIPLLLKSPLIGQPNVSKRPHLTFVSSGSAWTTDLSQAPSISLTRTTPIADISLPSNFPPGTAGGYYMYARSKLLLEYAMRRFAYLECFNNPTGQSAAIIVSSVCPGPVATDIARGWTRESAFWSGFVWCIAQLSRSPEMAKNIYISSLGADEEGRGQMWRDDELEKGDRLKSVVSEEGMKRGDAIWRELKGILRKMDVRGEGLVERFLGTKE